MHVLLTALGSYGDVHPMLGLAVRLAERGHEPQVLANPYFEQDVRRCGVGFVPVGEAADYTELTRHPDLWRRRQSLSMILREAGLRMLGTMHQKLTSLYRPGETVIAAHGLDLASRVVRDQLGAPVASVTFAPMAIWSSVRPPRLPIAFARPWLPRWFNQLQFEAGERLAFRPLIAPPLNELRRRVGLPPVGRLMPDWWYGDYCNLCLFPDWFAPPQRDWPSGSTCVGFPLWDGGREQRLSDACQAFLDAGDPPVAFTPGSANRQSEGFFADAVAACARLGRRGLLLTKYPEQLPPNLPRGVTSLAFEPLTKLLPRCAAFVHHGGIGSSSQALAAGVPQLIRPLAFDQLDNADRLCSLGTAEQLRPSRFNERSAAAALDRLLGSHGAAARCRRYATLCREGDALERGCEVLEGLLPPGAGRASTGSMTATGSPPATDRSA